MISSGFSGSENNNPGLILTLGMVLMFLSAAQKFSATMLDTFWVKATNIF